MVVRGAPLIGVTAAYGMALAARTNPSDQALKQSYEVLHATRPTAINLRWALDQMMAVLLPLPPEARAARAYGRAAELADEDVEINLGIGRHGLGLIEAIASQEAQGRHAQHSHPLQCRLAGDGRSWHGDGANLCRP